MSYSLTQLFTKSLLKQKNNLSFRKSPNWGFSLFTMKKITEIYKEYNIMPNLQMHQLRVAAVAKYVCENLNLEVDKNSIITACLLHDMGNIIKFKLEQFPEFLKPEGLDYWNNIKYNFILKYGNNEHVASREIAKELGVSSKVLDLIDCIDSHNVEIIKMDEDFNKKICLYADNRVTPIGISSVEERSLEAKERYVNHPHSFSEEKRIFYVKNVVDIENQIMKHCFVKKDEINDKILEENIKKLLDFSI